MANELIDAGAVERVRALAVEAAGKVVEIEGVAYSTTQLYNPRKAEPVPETLVFHTLQSLAEYTRSKIDAGYIDPRKIFVHVVNPTAVALRTGVFGTHNQRVCLAQAQHTPSAFQWGAWHDMEQMNCALQSLFEPTDGRAAALSLVGTVKHEAVQTESDNGVTQTAIASKGIVTVAKVVVPNPIMLRPYRTFVEVDQPDSPFILRMTGGGDKPLRATLLESDGGRWELAAVKGIKAYLAGELPGIGIFG